MRKTFCDVCESEVGSVGIARVVDRSILTNLGHVEIEINITKTREEKAIETATHGGRPRRIKNGSPDLCRNCIFDAIDQIDKRAKN